MRGAPHDDLPQGARDSLEDIPEDLRVVVEQVLAEARRQLENTGEVEPRFLLQGPDGKGGHLEFPERFLDCLDDPEAREVLFDALRRAIVHNRATAVVAVTDVWASTLTEAGERFRREDPERLERLAGEEAERLGLVVRREAVMVDVQTPERYAMVQQFYKRGPVGRRILWGERAIVSGPQSETHGRGKLFKLFP